MDNKDVIGELIGVVAVAITIVVVVLLCAKEKRNLTNANSSRDDDREIQEIRYTTTEEMQNPNEIGWVPNRLNSVNENVVPYAKVIEEMKKRKTPPPHKERTYYENWETNITQNKKKQKQKAVKSTKSADSRKVTSGPSKAQDDTVYDIPIMVVQAENGASVPDGSLANNVSGIEMTLSENEFNPEDIEFEENEIYEGGM